MSQSKKPRSPDSAPDGGSRRKASSPRAEPRAAARPEGGTEGTASDGGSRRKASSTRKASSPRKTAASRKAAASPSGSAPARARPASQPASRPASKPAGQPASEPATAAATATATIDGPDTSTLLLQVEGLTKTYAGRSVVHGVGFSVHRGEVIGLLGKNGAGKTTTFRMTIGMVAPDEGTIRFMNRDITRWPMYKRARLGMGYLSQEPSVFRGLTVEQNLNAILELTQLTPKDRVRRRDELVDEFGLGKLLHSKAAVLSGGEKRRLEIARALIMEPSLILLDEPFSGVDPIAVNDIQQIILGLRDRGIGILLTDHNVRETLNTTNRSFIILDGGIIAHGDRDAILADPNARKYYLGESFTM